MRHFGFAGSNKVSTLDFAVIAGLCGLAGVFLLRYTGIIHLGAPMRWQDGYPALWSLIFAAIMARQRRCAVSLDSIPLSQGQLVCMTLWGLLVSTMLWLDWSDPHRLRLNDAIVFLDGVAFWYYLSRFPRPQYGIGRVEAD